MPNEVLMRLLDLDIPVQFIYGNGEVAVLEQLAGRNPAAVPEQYLPVIRWTAQELHPAYQQSLAGWPKTLRVDIPGLDETLFCHGTPQNENECFTRLTPEGRLLRVFDGLNVPVVICGHTHMQFDRMIAGIRVVNAGSVGMPFGEPGADWLLLGPDVELRHTSYDLVKAAERIRETAYPQAEDFATRYVLHSPSEKEMLQLFTNVHFK
jgi:hypothetical protein